MVRRLVHSGRSGLSHSSPWYISVLHLRSWLRPKHSAARVCGRGKCFVLLGQSHASYHIGSEFSGAGSTQQYANGPIEVPRYSGVHDHLLIDNIRRVCEVDAAALYGVRLAHLRRAIGQGHHTSALFYNESLQKRVKSRERARAAGKKRQRFKIKLNLFCTSQWLCFPMLPTLSQSMLTCEALAVHQSWRGLA